MNIHRSEYSDKTWRPFFKSKAASEILKSLFYDSFSYDLFDIRQSQQSNFKCFSYDLFDIRKSKQSNFKFDCALMISCFKILFNLRGILTTSRTLFLSHIVFDVCTTTCETKNTKVCGSINSYESRDVYKRHV